MVHALSEIHKSLVPDGVMLDVHPQPQNSQIEVWQRGEVHPLGEVDQTEDKRDIEAARAHLESQVQRGLYAVEESGYFELLEHHPTVESWQERWAREGWILDASPELLRSARELLDRDAGDLVVREPVRATRLRRLEPVDQWRQSS